ncbi:ABC transporter permease [Fundicoccus culcitae]|uniref:ABC transporter permease n=1 Tax=Fundicoccus culcitae TaxID=2969821 RepID=A0ABY5P4L6_9LACT|nr:ABC transporter permease [Fundicoccus culcitae]UUX33651.1 ABC transporter permease [Fundicoccus culcitae]
MMFLEVFKSAFVTLSLNKRRTFLTMFGIIIGIAAVITILSLGNGFEQQTLNELARDEQGRPNQNFYFRVQGENIDFETLNPFSDELLAGLEETFPFVDEVSTDAEMMMDFGQSMTVQHAGSENYYQVEIATESNYQILAGRNLSQMDSDYQNHYIMIDEMLAAEIFNGVENALHRSLNLDGREYTIVGVYQSPPLTEEQAQAMSMGWYDFTQIVFPEGTYIQLYPSNYYNFNIYVYYTHETDMRQANLEVAQYLQDNGVDETQGVYEYYDSTEMMEQVSQQLRMITYFISAVAGISLFIAGVGVMNMMYISVSERVKEIGIRRAIGATQSNIQWQFLLEGITITTFGGLIGYGLGVAAAFAIANFLPFDAVLDVGSALVSVFVSVGIGIVFSVFPARSAARKNVVEILR